MVKIKVCGNQNQSDLNSVTGADAVGFIVSTPRSGRNLSPGAAARLVNLVPPFTNSVLVTTETGPEKLAGLASEVGPDYLQLHSELAPSRIEEIRESVPGYHGLIALLSVEVEGKRKDLFSRARSLSNSSADAILLDSKSGGRAGGTGKTHDWEASRMIRDAVHPFPVILAGGLKPGNVREAVEKVRPYAVDAASGLEASGDKSSEKTGKFIKEVKKSET